MLSVRGRYAFAADVEQSLVWEWLDGPVTDALGLRACSGIIALVAFWLAWKAADPMRSRDKGLRWMASKHVGLLT